MLTAAMIRAAREAADAWTTGTRQDGATYDYLTDDAPRWVREAVREAHGRDRDGAPAMLPDDYRHSFARAAFQTLADADEGDDPDQLADEHAEPDVYTGELLEWASSHAARLGYADEAADEYGEGMDTSARLALGQSAERREVWEVILAAVERAAEDEDEEEEEDDPAE